MSGRTAALLVMAALAASAQAVTYTCVAPDGRKSFSDRPCPVGNSEAARQADGTRSAAEKAAPHGLTFALMPLDASYKDVSPSIIEAGARRAVGASCHAAPAPLDRPRQGSCDPYRGDTACSRSLPLLCYRPALRSARAPTTVNANTGQIATPAAGPDNMAQLGSGPSIRGDHLLSESAASAVCEQALV